MWHDDAKARKAFRQGTRDAFESCVVRMDARQQRAVGEWRDDLDEWNQGDPNPPPVDW